jgi:hypothetical protein
MRAARRAQALVLASAALAAAGCGDGDDYANTPRAPAPINVTAAISDAEISVSPRRFGAGPIMLIISNQSGSPQEVTLESEDVGGSGPGLRQRTSAINPRGTATLKVDVRRGRYELRTGDRRIPPAAVRVGAERESSQNEIGLP